MLTAVFAARPVGPGELGWIGRWSPGIGDPTLVGWFTVVAYFLAAYLCFRTGKVIRVRPEPRLIRRERFIWLGLSAILVALGINKQLDLQTAMTEFFRMLAHEQGWYEYRREYQKAFIQMFALSGVVAATALVAMTWHLPRAMKIAGLGLCFVGCYVLIRAMSFHDVDHLIGRRLLLLKVNWIIELGGIGVICYGAYRRLES